MSEETLSRIRSQLQRRKDRLDKIHSSVFWPNLRRFWEFLKRDPWIAPLLQELQRNQTAKNAVANIERYVNDPAESNQDCRETVGYLKTDEDRAAFACQLFQRQIEYPKSFEKIAKRTWDPTNSNELLVFKQDLIFPFCDYLDERLDDQQAILGLLVRYKKRCEWFSRDDLRREAEEEQAKKGNSKKQAQVEERLKQDLYRYLHDQGTEFTVEPYSVRGEIDLILDQKSGTRRYVEAKVFDNDHRDSAHLVKGFGQLLHYLRQYNSLDGYLFVYKICEEFPEIEGAEQLGDIPFVRCGERVIFVLVADIFPYSTPVSSREYKPVRITADDLRKAKTTG